MSNLIATQNIKSAELRAVVTRLCRCKGEPVLDPRGSGRLVSRCGHAPKVEDRGVVAYYHRDPLKQLAAWLRGIRGRFTTLRV